MNTRYNIVGTTVLIFTITHYGKLMNNNILRYKEMSIGCSMLLHRTSFSVLA